MTKFTTTKKVHMKAVSINQKLQVRGPQGENIFTNMSFYGVIYTSVVGLYTFHFINIHGFDFQLI